MRRRITSSLRRLRVDISARSARRIYRGSLEFTAFSIVRTCSLISIYWKEIAYRKRIEKSC